MPTQDQQQQFGSKQVAYGIAPNEYPRSFPLTLTFANVTTLSLNFQEQSNQNILEWVQAVYVDNSGNTSEFSLTDSITQQKLTWPAGSQGYLPFMSGGKPVFTATIGVVLETLTVPIQLLTFAVPAIIWSVSGQTGSNGTDFSANKPALLANNIATVPVNSKRKSISVQNQAAVLIQVVLDNGAGGQVSIANLNPGTGANTQGGDWASQTFKGRVRIFATNTTDQVFVHED